MIDNMLLQCEHEETAREVYTLIGLALQLENEDEPPFAYLVPCLDFNGVDVEQSNTHIMISCQSYIDRMLQAYGWNSHKKKLSKNLSPLPDACLKSTKNVVLMLGLMMLTNLNCLKVLVIVPFLEK